MASGELELILSGLVGAVRDQDPEHIAAFLAPDVVWEGTSPDLRCDGREQAMEVIRHRFAAGPFAVEAVEVVAGESAVAVGLRGPGFNETPGDLETVGQIYNVFSVRDGKVVRWRDYLVRREALAAAGAAGHEWQ
ncbi:MAG: nuclear transport factor 2 family protein [Streptosporangiaceae bacterium]